jgi:hypothetical protein
MQKIKLKNQLPIPRLVIFAALFALLMVLLAVIGGYKGYSSVPYWDMWDGTLNFAIKVSQGDWSVWWAQHNEHRIVLSRILFWVDINWFGGLAIFLILVNFLIVAISAFILWRVLRLYNNQTSNKNYDTLIGFFIVGWVFQWMQSQNFIWGFQSQFLLVQLLPLCAFIYLSKSVQFSKFYQADFFIACLFGVLSIGTMANGLIVLPLMLIYVLILKQSKGKIAIIAFLSIITSYFYLVDYKSPGGHGSILETIKHDPIGLLQYTLTYLGSPFHYLVRGWLHGYFAMVSGAAFIVLYLTLVFRSTSTFDRNPLKFGLFLYIAFIICTAFVTGGGRLLFGVNQALDSRYTTPAIMAWAVLLILYSPLLVTIIRKNGLVAKCLILVLFLSILTLQFKALDSQRQMLFQRKVAALAIAMGIDDSQLISSIYPSSKNALQIGKEAQQINISLFNEAPYKYSDHVSQDLINKHGIHKCIGSIDLVKGIDGSKEFVKVGGWFFDVDTKSVPDYIRFQDDHGQILGAAIIGAYRPDVEKNYLSAALHSGFEGYIKKNKLGSSILVSSDSSLCKLTPLFVPSPPFDVSKAKPYSNATEITIKNIRNKNDWLGSDYQKSQFEGMRVFGSYMHKGDGDTGSVSLVIKPEDKLFYRSGPSGGRQLLRIGGNNKVIVMPIAEDWVLLNFSSGRFQDLPPEGLSITISDEGVGWGEWSAIAINQRGNHLR